MRKLYFLLTGIITILLSATSLFAVGVSPAGIGARATALGGSYRAISDDWSGMYWNPAGITQIKRWHVGLATELLWPVTTYTPALWNDSIFSVTRQADTQNKTHIFAVPCGGVVRTLSDNLSVGLGAWVPFGQVAQWDLLDTYDYNSAFPEFDYKIDFKSFDIHPTVAYKLNDKISVGAGIGLVYADIMILQPLFNPNPYSGIVEYGGINVASMVGSGFQDSLKTVNGLRSRFNHLVTESEIAVSGFGYSANCGAMVTLNDQLQIGISGRYYGDVTLSGTMYATMYYATSPEAQQLLDSKWSDTTSFRFQALQGAYTTGRIKEYEKNAALYAYSGGASTIYTNAKAVFTLPLPADVGMGITYKAINKNDRHLFLSSDFQYTFNSVWKVFDIDINDDEDTIQFVQNWKNTYRVSLGIEYKMNPVWTLRSAYYHEKNAGVTETLIPIFPDISSRNSINLGFQYTIKPNIALHCSYEGIFYGKQSFDTWVYNDTYKNDNYDNMAGIYNFHVNNLMLGLAYNF